MPLPAAAAAPLKVVLVGSFTPASQPGGVTTHCTRLAERLAATPRCAVRRINVKLRGTLARSLFRSNPATWLLAALRARLCRHRVFHFNTSARNLPFPALAPALRLLGCRLILSFHSGALASNLGKRGAFADALFRLSLALAHRVVFMNERERAAVATRHPRHAAKFAVIHSFIAPSAHQLQDARHAAAAGAQSGTGGSPVCLDARAAAAVTDFAANPVSAARNTGEPPVPLFTPAAAPDTPALQTPPPPYVIAAMGAWLPYYNFEEIVAALRPIAAAHPAQRFELRIASALFNLDPAYKQQIQTLAAAVNSAAAASAAAAPPNLRVTTAENVEDPLAFLAASDLVVRASSVDSFGLCVAEAIFLGKPVIATNVCRRVEGTLLYAPHDLAALESHIRLAHQRHRDGTQPPLSLPPAEDAFPRLLQLYHEEAAV